MRYKGLSTAAILAAAATMAYSHELPVDFHFKGDSDFFFHDPEQVDLSIADGVLRADITGNDPRLHLDVVTDGPIIITARMRSGEGAFDRMEIFWKTPDDRSYSQDRVAMFPLEHDMEWREHEFPLPVTEGPVSLRFDTGWKPGVFEFDWIRIDPHPLPDHIKTQVALLPEEIHLENEALSVSLLPETADFDIVYKRTGRKWHLDPSDIQAAVYSAKRLSDTSIELGLIDRGEHTKYTSTVTLSEDRLEFTLDTEDTEALFWGLRNWPPVIKSDLADGRIVFADRSSGTLIGQRDAYYSGRELTIYGNTQAVDMPFVGLFDWDSGEGVMILAETPADGHFVMGSDQEELIWPRLRWRQSLDTFRYRRKASYHFSPGRGYVGLAELYRAYAIQVGRHKTLHQKAQEAPQLDKLMGGALIWGSTDVNDFAAEARTRGILRAGFGNATHGLRDRRNGIRRLNEMGYITFEYDSFSDIVDGPTGMQSDDVDETAYHARPGLGPKGGWVNPDGSRYSERSSAYALRAIKSYVPDHVRKYGFNGRFIDVSMAIDLQEDWHPNHTFDRRMDMEYKREAFAWFRTLGLVVGTEHGNDWGMDLVDFTEGAAGSPLHWERQGNWWSGGLVRPESADVYLPEWLEYGIGHHTSVPLWQIVYQDAVISSWYWGDTPGIHYEAAPWVADRKDLFTMLYGSMTLLWRDNTGYDWNVHRDRFLQTYHDTAHLHGAVAYARLLDHRFLSEDKNLQETRFDNGTTVAVNFGEEPRSYTTPRGREVLLAPIGYWAEGPKIFQARTIIDADVVKRIETEDFLQYASERRRRIGPVEFEGTFTAFRMPEGHWQLVVEPGRLHMIDLEELTGWAPDGPLSLLELDEVGRRKRALPLDIRDGVLRLASGPDSRFFAIKPSQQDDAPLLYPPEGEIIAGEKLQISHPDEGAVVRYTLDGSTPTADSSRVPLRGLRIPDSGTVTARAFRNGLPVGGLSSGDYQLVQRTHESGIIRSGEVARRVNVSTRGANRLRIRVGIGADVPWADFVDVGYPTLVRADGTEVRLTELEPISSFQVYEEPTVDLRDDDGPLVVAGRHFEWGLGLRAEAELVYQLDGEFDRFKAWIGINDRAADNPSLMKGSADVTVDILP